VTNAFTIDVEEWFHVCGVPAVAGPSAWDALESRVVDDTQRTLDLLDRCGIRATCFVVGWVAERHPGVIARIREAGHEIGSHGQWHRRVYELEPDEFTRDLRLANASLVAAGAPRPTQFRAPEWSINGRAPCHYCGPCERGCATMSGGDMFARVSDLMVAFLLGEPTP